MRRNGLSDGPVSVVLNSGGFPAMGKSSDKPPPNIPNLRPNLWPASSGNMGAGPLSTVSFGYVEPSKHHTYEYSVPMAYHNRGVRESVGGLLRFNTSGMPVFMYKKGGPVTFGMNPEHVSQWTILDPVTFNKFLAETDDSIHGLSAAQVLESWSLEGVVATDTGPDLDFHNRVDTVRQIAIVSKGYLNDTGIRNYFSPLADRMSNDVARVERGADVGFILTRCATSLPHDTEFVLSLDGINSWRPFMRHMPALPDDEEERAQVLAHHANFRPFQLVPWTGHGMPSRKEMIYKNYEGKTESAVYIRLGRSDDTVAAKYPYACTRANRPLYDVRDEAKVESIVITLDIKMHFGYF